MRRAPSALPDDLTSRCRQQRCPEDWARLHPCLLCLPGGVTADDVIILTSLTRAEGTEAWSVDGIVRYARPYCPWESRCDGSPTS